MYTFSSDVVLVTIISWSKLVILSFEQFVPKTKRVSLNKHLYYPLIQLWLHIDVHSEGINYIYFFLLTSLKLYFVPAKYLSLSN